jgi:hypothetical protein
VTVCGFAAIDLRRALVWCDSEVYREGEPSGEACKIAVNAFANIVGTGTGSLLMLAEAAATIQGSATVDDAVVRLPGALRAVHRAAAPSVAARAMMALAAFVVVGRSPRFGRVVGWVLPAERDFLPALISAWCCPAVDAANVLDEHGALAAAQAQLAELRRSLPNATGGTLMVATIDGDRITVGRAFDLATGLRPSRRLAEA